MYSFIIKGVIVEKHNIRYFFGKTQPNLIFFQTSNPDVTVNPQPPTTNTTTIQAPQQPDLNKESTTTPVFNTTTSQQQQHNSHYETKEIDIDSQELFIITILFLRITWIL